MKTYLHILALLVASALPGVAMAATNYGIRISGTTVTSDNASNITGSWLRSGSIKYDYSSNVLTFTDADIFGDSGVTIENTCKNQLHLRFNGVNTISSNSVAFSIKKYDGYSRTDVYFETTEEGVLNINWHTGSGVETLYGGGIYCYESNGGAPWVCIGSGTRGAHTALTINATSISGGGGGRLVVDDGFLNLKGSAYCAIKGFQYVSFNTADRYLQTNGATYSSENKRLEKDGSLYTGTVNTGWNTYDLFVGGRQVHYQNKDDIRVFTHRDAWNLAMSRYGSQNMEEAATGAVRYDPSSNTLTLSYVEIRDYNNTAYSEAVIDNQTGKPFTLKTSNAALIYTVFGKQKAAIRTNSDITFTGGQFTADTNDPTCSCLLMDGNHLMATFDNGSLTHLDGISGTGNQGSAMDVANEGDKMRVTTKKCTMEMTGSCRNFEYWKFDGSEIQTANVFADEDRGYLCKNFNGTVSLQDYTTDIVPVTTSYGITVGGHPLNNVNKDNFYYADVKGTVLYDPDEKVLYLEDVNSQCAPHKMINSNNEVVEWHSNGINVMSSAPVDLRIELSGTNRFLKIDGVGMTVYKNTKITGYGALYLEKPNDSQGHLVRASICMADNADLSLLDNIEVYASELYGSEGNGGNLIFFEDDPTEDLAKLSLYSHSGQHPNPTIRGIASIGTRGYPASYGDITSELVQPNGGNYDTSDKVLLTSGNQTSYGTEYKGNVLIQPVAYYGIMVHSWPVTSFNCNDILQGTDYSYTGKLSYDVASTTLTMDNLQTEGAIRASGIQIRRVPSENTCTTIKLIGENEWTDPNWFRVSAGYAKFTGGGSLNYPSSIVLERGAEVLKEGNSGILAFEDCTINATNIRSRVGSNWPIANGWLYIDNATIRLSGSEDGTIIGFEEEPWMFETDPWMDGTRIITPSDWSWYVTPEDGAGNHTAYLTTDGNTKYTGPVVMYPCYGIFVAGNEITSENKDDVLGDGGSVSYTRGTYITDDDYWKEFPQLTLNHATINGTISINEQKHDGKLVVQLIDDNTINAGRSTAIESQGDFIVQSDNAYGKLFVNTAGTGIELKNSAIMQVGNAELNISAGTYGIKGQAPATVGNAYDGYESLYLDPFYTKLVVKNNNSRYALIGNLFAFEMADGLAVQEPARAVFDAEKCGFVGSNGNLLSNTTLIISNDDYNTVGIGEMKNEKMKNEKWAGAVYDLSGRKMNSTRIQRGLYIADGKKVAVK